MARGSAPSSSLGVRSSSTSRRTARSRRWFAVGPRAFDSLDVHAKNELGLKALLVRPDGVVAWVAEDAADLESLSASLSRWFGAAES